tara:strand:+ start:3993 stop:6902 length:2910 start_codon:yes stop_codon:yes gene_type:complete
MKKFLVFLGIFMLLIIAIIVAIPLMFKAELQKMAMDEANKSVNAKIELGDFDLSLIPNFPRLTVEISDLSVTGINQFEGVTLFGAKTITTTLDVMKLYNGDIEIGEVGVDGVDVNVIVLKDGTANYDIAIEADNATVEEVDEAPEEMSEGEESSDFKMKLQRYYIHNFNLTYDDQQGDMFFELKNMNHDGKGDFTLAQFILETKTTVESMSFKMEGDELLKKASLNSEINMAMDMDQMRFQFDTTYIQLNALVLNVDGWLAMPNDSIDMDIAMSSRNNSFKELFSLIPNAYIADYADVKVKGSMSFGAAFKGIYYEDMMPAFEINLGVKNGEVKYPDLPATAENIGIDLAINSPGSDLGNMVVDLKKAHLELADNFFDMSMRIKKSITNPTMTGNFKMDFDLATLPTMMPVEEGEEYKGKLKTDLNFKADVNSLDNEQYDKIEADGLFEAWDIEYDDGTGGIPMNISHIAMKFDMNKVDLTAFDATVGKSDVHAIGTLENFIPWYMTEATLKGGLEFSSTYFDVDEWMTDEPETEVAATEVPESTDEVTPDSAVAETYEIPTNIDFVMNSKMKLIGYDSMKIEDLVGTIIIRNGQVIFQNVAVNMFEGNATMDGVFDPTTAPQKPTYVFDMGIHNWGINPVAITFNTIDKLAPILKTTSGTFSTDMHIDGSLDANLDPILEELSFDGISTTKNVEIHSKSLEKLNGITKTTDYNPMKAEDLTFKYRCVNGVLEIEPFEVKVGSQKAKISGTTNLNQDINYLIDTKIKTSEMGAGADAVIGQLNGLLASNGVKAEVPDVIPVMISVTGKMDDPVFKPVFGKGEASKGAKEQVKEIVKEQIKEVKEDVKKQAQAEADKIMADARKQQEDLMNEARKQAAELNKEAKKLGVQLKAEADKQGKDLISQATNPLTKIAAEKGAVELNKQADKKAKQLEAEADKQGKAALAKAQQQSDKIMAEAKKKADAKIQGL